MLDFIFDIVCDNKYNVMVLVIKDGVLYGIPCEEYISGDYPAYDKKVKLSESNITDFDLDGNEAIKITRYGNEMEIKLSSDTWDGYQ